MGDVLPANDNAAQSYGVYGMHKEKRMSISKAVDGCDPKHSFTYGRNSNRTAGVRKPEGKGHGNWSPELVLKLLFGIDIPFNNFVWRSACLHR